MPTRTQANSYLIPTRTYYQLVPKPSRTQYQLIPKLTNYIELLLLCNVSYEQEHNTLFPLPCLPVPLLSPSLQVTVASCLRQTLNCSVMIVFTLVQSRTHVDTVQNVLHVVTNSRHICWSHTVKVLGWCVTFVTDYFISYRIKHYRLLVWV